MSGFGFGFGSIRNSSARYVALVQASSIARLSPSYLWNGTPGSGFATIPVDPLRITAKPAMRLLVPPNQYFRDEILVGVLAGANDHGSLVDNMGLKEVVVHYEGSRTSVTAPSFFGFADANGTYRNYFGWWAMLRHDGRNGHAQVYFEAVPNDATMQSRVTGPYQFSPQPAVHDATITVAASGGAQYQDLADALAFCRSSAFGNPLVKVTEAGVYDIADRGQAYEGAGYCTITATVPNVRIAKASYTNDAAAALRSRYAGLRFAGAFLTVDTKFISEIYSEAGTNRCHWMDGCSIINTAGQGALWRGVTRPNTALVRDGAWFTECYVENVPDAFALAKLARGTTEINGISTLYAGCPAVIGNVSSGHRDDLSRAKDLPALSVRYSGAAATATIEVTGVNSAATRTVIVKIAGSADRTFVLDKSEAAYATGTNYTLPNLVTWLNAIPSMTATLLDTSSGRAGIWLGLPGQMGAAFGARDIKAAPLTLVSYIDAQTIWWKDLGVTDNVVIWGNLAVNLVGTDFDLNSANPKRDFLIADNAIQNDKSSPNSASLSSQLAGTQSHVVLAHNTLATQQLILRTDATYVSSGYNLVANNSMAKIGWGGAAGTTPIINNHIHGGQSVPASALGQANVSGTTRGGDDASLYADALAGDFRARGMLLVNLAPSVLRYNGAGDPFLTVDVKGAYDAVPQATITTAASVSQYGMTFNFDQPYQVAQYANGDWAVIGPVVINSITPAGVVWNGAFDDGTPYTNRIINGAELNSGNRAHAPGGLITNNLSNSSQGWDNGTDAARSGATMQAYDPAKNIDPGATGAPLMVSSGSVVKVISQLAPPVSGRAALTDMAVLTVTDAAPVSGTLRPAIAVQNKRPSFNESDFDLSVFNNFPRPASAPTAAQAAAMVARMFEVSRPDSINSRNIHASNNHWEYGQDIARDVHNVLACLHLSFTPAEKLAMLRGLAALAIDIWGRSIEGGEAMIAAGGGNGWKKAALVVVTAALRNASDTAARDSMRTYCDAAAKFIFAEDRQIIPIDDTYINTPRSTANSTIRAPYAQWMHGAPEFIEDYRTIGLADSSWSARYRAIFCNALLPGVLAVALTTGAKALWNREEVFTYLLGTQWNNEKASVGVGTNALYPFPAAFISAYRSAEPAPTLVAVGIKGNDAWLRFNRSLDESSVPAASDFIVRVNGVVRAASLQGVWRTNCGLLLSGAAITSNDVVTVMYAVPGTGALRSVDGANVAAISTAVTLTNLTASVGGTNASYPVVRFTAANPDVLQPTAAAALSLSDSPRWTLWIPHIKIFALPTATIDLFGLAGGAPIFEIQIDTTGRIGVFPRQGSSLYAQIKSTALTPNTAYSVRIDCDATDPSSTTGVNVYLNGVSAKNSVASWSGAAGKTTSFTTASTWKIGGTAAPYFDGELGGMWLDTQNRVTDPLQIAKFTSLTNGSLDIGTLGDGINGARPSLFIMGNAAQYNSPAGVNRGKGPQFFKSSGAVLDVSGSTWR